jgi:hypothetical protein
MILTTVVYPKVREMIMNAHWIFSPRRAESVTAIAAEVISGEHGGRVRSRLRVNISAEVG